MIVTPFFLVFLMLGVGERKSRGKARGEASTEGSSGQARQYRELSSLAEGTGETERRSEPGKSPWDLRHCRAER